MLKSQASNASSSYRSVAGIQIDVERKHSFVWVYIVFLHWSGISSSHPHTLSLPCHSHQFQRTAHGLGGSCATNSRRLFPIVDFYKQRRDLTLSRFFFLYIQHHLFFPLPKMDLLQPIWHLFGPRVLYFLKHQVTWLCTIPYQVPAFPTSNMIHSLL